MAEQNRSNRSAGKPGGRPNNSKPAGKSFGGKPGGKSYGSKPDDRPSSGKPYGDRPAGKPYGDKPVGKTGSGKPYGDRPAGRPYGRPRPEAPPDIKPRPESPAGSDTRGEDRLQPGGPHNDVICGRNAVLETLKSGQEVNRVLVADNIEPAFAAAVFKLCKELGVPCTKLPKQQLQRVAGPEHHGVVAEIAAAAYAELSDILALAAERNEPPFIVVLDGVEDPHNLGAVIRTALAAGAHGLVISKRRAVALNQTVMKTSAGAAAYLPVARVGNINQALQELKEAGLWLVAGDMDGQLLWETNMRGPLALVLGGEGAGLSPLVKKNCDLVAAIPMTGPVGSLNVSVSAAVLLYEAVRQRG